MIPRPVPLKRIQGVFKAHPIAALLGPRQCGKTTLAGMIREGEPATFFDLENPVDVQRMAAPMTTLQGLSGLVIIDEIQRMPQLFELLRVLVDQSEQARFLVLGSASPALVKRASETLAGRVGFVDLSGFSLDEVGSDRREVLWNRGGFPRSFLASDDTASFVWRQNFVRTFLERDIPQLGITTPAETLRRFWTMIAHYHAQVWNAAELGRSLGSSENTARRYLDIFAGAFVVRVLPPWFENLKKRQVKAPKIYIRDSGILHALLQLAELDDVLGHPKLGASWEGFALEHIISIANTRDTYFWATHSGAELDLLILKSGRRYGFELKYSDAPSLTRSMHIALEDLKLQRLWVVYPGEHKYALHERVSAIPLSAVADALEVG
jgi:predicted AAA+ superfamily ATPase